MYLPKLDRERLNLTIDRVIVVSPWELSYAITRLSLNLLDISTGPLVEGQLTGILGAMERAKHEFNRRIVEQQTVHQVRKNGDPYGDFIRRRNI